ncbi:MAG: ABC transporter permease, partial [Deltaproteobacteria bacterium]|nr:ABC transporter permease [Deltaproteobacteria bacterium]
MSSSYIARRLLLLIPTMLGVVTLVFSLRPLIPGDPIDYMLGEQAQPADRMSLIKEFHLDLPIHRQYLIYLGEVITGDLGQSIHTRKPVINMIMERFPATLMLTLGAIAISICIAIPAGVLSAVKRGSFIDYGAMFFALLGVAMPNFWLGPLLILLFSINLGWLPVSGTGGLSHMILPAMTLGTSMAAILTRMTRSSMLEVIKEDFITTARAKGLQELTVLMKHALRNALIPIITLIGLQFGGLLAGSIITETIFSWPGIGTLIITAINSRDFPVLQGCVMAISLSYV